jgi:hypothetical protein
MNKEQIEAAILRCIRYASISDIFIEVIALPTPYFELLTEDVNQVQVKIKGPFGMCFVHKKDASQ